MNNHSERHGQEASYTIRDVATSDVASYRRILHDSSPRDRYYRFFHHVSLHYFDDVRLRRELEPCTDAVGMIAQDGIDPLARNRTRLRAAGWER